MAKILSDKDIKKLIGSILINASEEFLNPNGIELRLGEHVLFHSTKEEKELNLDMFLKVSPGEFISIASIETIDFRPETVKKIFPGYMFMAFITPTTTMMREGISQVATKIDSGFHGILNWGLQNNSTKDLILQHGEPIFKLTIFALTKDESPEITYGSRPYDYYQDSNGIVRSKRRIPADIPKSKLVSSSFGKLDPKKQLKEAGYPFNHISTELTELHGKFEIISSDVRFMKEEFQTRISELTQKIETKTNELSNKLEDTPKNILEKVEILFEHKFLKFIGILIGAIPILYGGITFLQKTTLGGNVISFICMVVGIIIILVTFLLSNRSK